MQSTLQSGWFRWLRRVLSILFGLSALFWLGLWIAIQSGLEIEDPDRWSRISRAIWQAFVAWWLWPPRGATSFDDEDWLALLYSEMPDMDIEELAKRGTARYSWRFHFVNSLDEVPSGAGPREVYYVNDEHVCILVIGGVVYSVRGGSDPLSSNPEDIALLTEGVEDLRLAAAIRGHEATILIEVEDPREAGLEGTFAVKCKIASLFADQDCVALGVPERSIFVPPTSGLLAQLGEATSPEHLDVPYEPPVLRVPSDDVEMEAAIDKARRHLDDFDAAFRNCGTAQGFHVKFRLETGFEPENIWLEVADIREDAYDGRLGNEPVHGNHSIGDAMVVPRDQVLDWLYTLDGRMIGGRTFHRLDKGEDGAVGS